MARTNKVALAPFERTLAARVAALGVWLLAVWRWLVGREAATAQYRGGFFIGPWLVQPLPLTRIVGGAVFHTADGGVRIDSSPGGAFRLLVVGKPWGQSVELPVERTITAEEASEIATRLLRAVGEMGCLHRKRSCDAMGTWRCVECGVPCHGVRPDGQEVAKA